MKFIFLPIHKSQLVTLLWKGMLQNKMLIR
jgi:hypothetical protein